MKNRIVDTIIHESGMMRISNMFRPSKLAGFGPRGAYMTNSNELIANQPKTPAPDKPAPAP